LILTAHQPSYLPWLGYFNKISKSDIYIFLDSVQLEKNSYSYRNKIKTPQGTLWLTIPLKLKGHTSKVIKDILIDNTQQWKKKHLKSIYHNYKKSTYFNELYPKLENLYEVEYDLFSDLTYNHLIFWLNELNIKTIVAKSSDLTTNSKNSDLILDLCKHFNADRYISGLLGKDYLIEDDFISNNIKIKYQDFRYPVYQQLYGEFVSHLGIIDFWMNTHQNKLLED
jgi:hypothetical protein